MKLIELKPEDFDHKTWVALAWARDWTLFRDRMPDEELIAEFESLYNEQERADIRATVTAMDFANRFMNTTSGDILVPPSQDNLKGSAIRGKGWRYERDK